MGDGHKGGAGVQTHRAKRACAVRIPLPCPPLTRRVIGGCSKERSCSSSPAKHCRDVSQRMPVSTTHELVAGALRAEVGLAAATHAGSLGKSSAAGESDGSTLSRRPGPATHSQRHVKKQGSVRSSTKVNKCLGEM